MASALVDPLMVGAEREAQHNDPIWRDRSNFIIAADISDYSDAPGREQLWARQISESLFEICCIPFFVYDLALGDVVETAALGGRDYMVTEVVEPSGRFVFRVWFGDTAHPRDEVVRDLVGLGALCEWSSVNLLAVDASNQQHAAEIVDYLAGAAAGERLIFEAGRST